MWQAEHVKKRHAAPVHRENVRVPAPAWGSMPDASSPVHQSARLCSPKVHAFYLSSTLEPKPNSRVLGENRSPVNIYSGPLPFLPPTPRPEAPSSPGHETKPTLLTHGRDLCGSPDAPHQCPVHPISSPVHEPCVINVSAAHPSGQSREHPHQPRGCTHGGWWWGRGHPSPLCTCTCRFPVIGFLFLVEGCYYG